MDINKDFVRPDKFPFEMCRGYKHASEKESILLIIFKNAWLKDNLYEPFVTNYSHPDMEEDGLLEDVGDGAYCLTTKSIGLLYSVYGRKNK